MPGPLRQGWRRCTVFAALVVATVSPGGQADDGELDGRTFALHAAKIFTVSSGVIDDGTLLVQDGKIVSVGRNVDLPDDVLLIDLPRQVIIPGLIDAETALTGEFSDVRKSISPEVRALDAWDFFADRSSLLRGGVTTVYVSPGISTSRLVQTRLVSGRGCVVKLAGHDDDPPRRVVRAASGVQVTIGDLPKNPPSIYDPPITASPDDPFEVVETQLPRSRPGTFLALRRLLARVRAYRDALAEAERGGSAPVVDPEAAALLALLRGEDYLRVRANRARDIFHMQRFARENGLTMVLEGGREATRLASQLAEANVPVIVEGPFRPGVIPRGDLAVETIEGRYRPESLLELIEAGIEVVLRSPTDREVKDLMLQAASSVSLGIAPERALRTITLGAAEVLRVADRIGSLESGKDADFVVLGGAPFSAAGDPLAVFIDGELVYHSGPASLAKLDSRPRRRPSATKPRERLIIRCGRLLTGTGGDFAGGVVVVEDGKVTYAGAGLLTRTTGSGAKVLDASRWTVVPGLIDAASYFGARVESLARLRGSGSGEGGGAGRSTVRLADVVDPSDPERQTLLRSGLTTVLLSPSVVGQIGGKIAAWKLSGGTRDEVEVEDYAALLLSAGFRDAELKKIKKYHDDWTAYEKKSEEAPPEGEKKEEQPKKAEPPRRNDAYEPYRPLFEKEVPVVIQSANASQLAATAKRLAESYGMRVIVAGSPRVDEITASLRALDVGVILSVPFTVVEPPGRRRINVPERLDDRGVRFAFGSYAGPGGGDLVPQVAYAVEQGLSQKAALEAMTIEPARLFGIDRRVGSLEEGKDADLVFLSGSPFSLTTRVVGVMIEGKVQFLEEEREKPIDD